MGSTFEEGQGEGLGSVRFEMLFDYEFYDAEVGFGDYYLV